MPKNRPRSNSKWLMLTKPAPGEGRVIGQVRFSSKLQDMRSIAEQKQNIVRGAGAEGWEVVGWTEEPETSAQYDELEGRPEFLHLLTNLAGRECNVIMCDETSRWSRSEVGNKALRMLRERGCWWQTADNQWDINKPLTDGGAIMWAITQSQNEDYLRKLSYHVRKGKKAKAREGYSNGYPMFGYQVPEIHIAPQLGNLQREREIRRRIVYTPHPTYFTALQKLGELLSEQPPRSASSIAAEMNRLGYTYWSPQRGERRWVAKYVYHLMERSYHREYAPGCGHGTVETPDGERIEGLHIAAWPYDVCQRVDENHARTATNVRIVPAVRKGTLAFSGLISCVHCERRMATHRSSVNKHGVRYEYDYYACQSHEYLEGYRHAPHRHAVRSIVIDHQFGQLLDHLGEWSQEATSLITQMYTQEDAAGADPVADYERQRSDLARERTRALEQHRKGYIEDDELDAIMLDLRKRESRLAPPTTRHDQLSRGLQAVQTIMSLGAQWRAADAGHNQRLRHALAYALLQPDGLLFDPVEQRIVGLIADPDMHLAVKTMLEPHGWSEEDGALWNRESAGVPAPHHQNRYYQIMLVLKRQPATSAELQRFLGMKRQNIAEVLARMITQGVVSRRPLPKQNKYEYTWIGGDTVPQDALRLWQDRKGRYTPGPTPSLLGRRELLPVR